MPTYASGAALDPQQSVRRRVQNQLAGTPMEPVAPNAIAAPAPAAPVPSPDFAQPTFGQMKTFPNGRQGKWDGKGWLHIG